MPFLRPTLNEILDRDRGDLDAWLPGADSRLRRSVLDVLLRAHAGTAHGLYGYLDWTARQVLPDTAESEVLARHASVWGVTRKPAVAAGGAIVATGANGSIIDAGAVLVRADGARFVVEAAAMIAAGTASLAVEAEEPGPSGNSPAGQLLTLASPIAGVDAQLAVVAPGLIGGVDEEGDDDLRARLLLRIRNQPHGGNRSDYQRWALEVPGVTRAWVYPAWLGIGTVGVAFVMDGRIDPIPLAADVDLVQDYIDLVRPVTAALTVFAPPLVPLNLNIDADPPTAEVEAAIAAEIRDMLFREAEPGGQILISHIREAISIAPGEYDHQLISPVANVDVGPGEMLVMGSITWA